tara:strand:- start:13 stop:480 length:468 start_codon:yes stop_codon:yes gene_type:complete
MARRYEAYIPPPEVRPDEFTMPAGKAWGEEDFFFAEDIFKMDIGLFEDPAVTKDVDEASKLFTYSSDVFLTEADHFVGIDTSAEAVTVMLPLSADVRSGKQLVIKDEGNNASVYPITIKSPPADGATIDGYSEVKIVSNSGAISIYYNGSGWHIY